MDLFSGNLALPSSSESFHSSVAEINHRLKVLIDLVKSAPKQALEQLNPEPQYLPLNRVESIVGICLSWELPPLGSKIIDVGTGYGYGAAVLSAMGYEVLGIDLNQDRLERGMKFWKSLNWPVENMGASGVGSSKMFLLASKISDLGPEHFNQFDAGTCFFLSEYMGESGGAFHDVARFLTGRAKFFASTEGDMTKSESARARHLEQIASMLKNREVSFSGLEFESYRFLAKERIFDPHLFTFSKIGV